MGGLGAPLETYPGGMKAGVEPVKLPFLVSSPTALYLEGQALLTPQGTLGGPGRKLQETKASASLNVWSVAWGLGRPEWEPLMNLATTGRQVCMTRRTPVGH